MTPDELQMAVDNLAPACSGLQVRVVVDGRERTLEAVNAVAGLLTLRVGEEMTGPRWTGGHLRDGRYCSSHGVDLIPPDRTWRTRRYCNQCPPGSELGFPLGMVP